MAARLLRLADRIDRSVALCGRIAAWLIVPLVLTVFVDLVNRALVRHIAAQSGDGPLAILNSPALQDAEWYQHAALFAFALSLASVRGFQVRLDIVRAGMSERQRTWVDLLGGLFLLLPFCAVLVVDGWLFFYLSWSVDESPQTATGLGDVWLVKGALFVGFVLLTLAGIASVLRAAGSLLQPE